MDIYNEFVSDMRGYLDMIEGPRAEPFDCHTKSHWRLLHLRHKYGWTEICTWLDWYFEESTKY